MNRQHEYNYFYSKGPRSHFSRSATHCMGEGLIRILPGQYFDTETGTHYNYFRDYDPTIGRYVQSDPIGLRGGINTYGYAAASPLLYSDPDGRQVVLPLPPIVGPVPPPVIPGLPGNPPPGFNIPEFPTPNPITLCLISPMLCAMPAMMNMVEQACKDEPDCQRATPWQLSSAGFGDPEQFKSEYVGRAGGRFDICACKDGSVQLKAVGQCGKPGSGITTPKMAIAQVANEI